jgi:hypothetical protein
MVNQTEIDRMAKNNTVSPYIRALAAIRAGKEIKVNTPTGKIFYAEQQQPGKIIISTESKMIAQRGEEAQNRLKNALRTIGTEWSIKPIQDRQ